MPLNQGLGAGDPDKRMPAQKLTIIRSPYFNQYQILQGSNHVRAETRYQGLKQRIPLITRRFGSQINLAWKRYTGKL